MSRKPTRQTPSAMPEFSAAARAGKPQRGLAIDADDPCEILSLQLRLIIQGRGLKLVTVERLAKCSINRWYRGHAKLSPANLIKVAGALGLSLLAVDRDAIPDNLPLPAKRAISELEDGTT